MNRRIMTVASLASLALLAYGAGAATVAYYWKVARPTVHQLEQPLQLYGGDARGPAGLLPIGTMLYYDRAFPEGFVRYYTYVNVEGILLDGRRATERFWVAPLMAAPLPPPHERPLDGQSHEPEPASAPAGSR